MKKTLLLTSSILLFASIATLGQTTKSLKKALELKIPREGGANAATVAWHPVQKKYYAAMAGNVDYCMAVFDVNGKLLSKPEQKTLFDVRGFWYNPASNTLQTNGYNDFGWGEYKLDSKGIPIEIKTYYQGLHQPDEQSVGAYNPKEKEVYFFNTEGNIEKYDFTNGEYVEDIELHLGQTKEEADSMFDNYDFLDSYNNTSVIYTGVKGAELGLLNHSDHQIELYNIETGYISQKLTLPEDAPAKEFLNFAFSNGIYWLFDNEARVWKGYK